jgi:DnaK suppressor protein
MLELKETHDLWARLSEDNEVDPLFITRLEQKRRHIENALLRFLDGTYGTCLMCGSEIETDRLHVLPYAALCLHCQQKKEMGSL